MGGVGDIYWICKKEKKKIGLITPVELKDDGHTAEGCTTSSCLDKKKGDSEVNAFWIWVLGFDGTNQM